MTRHCNYRQLCWLGCANESHAHVRMELDERDDLVLYRPDGSRFLSFLQLDAGFRETRETLRRERLEREEAERRADRAEAKAANLAARLRALGIDPDQP